MKLKGILGLAVALLINTGIAMATPYNESGDAGQTIGTSQSVVGSGSLTTIYGLLREWDADMFHIWIDGGFFVADTRGSEFFDPMLHLYNASGNRILYNDDWIGFQSAIGSSYLPAGDYYLTISPYPYGWQYDLASQWPEASYRGGIPYQINLDGASYIDAAPVPEPSTVLLLGAGLAGLGLLKRRKV